MCLDEIVEIILLYFTYLLFQLQLPIISVTITYYISNESVDM